MHFIVFYPCVWLKELFAFPVERREEVYSSCPNAVGKGFLISNYHLSWLSPIHLSENEGRTFQSGYARWPTQLVVCTLAATMDEAALRGWIFSLLKKSQYLRVVSAKAFILKHVQHPIGTCLLRSLQPYLEIPCFESGSGLTRANWDLFAFLPLATVSSANRHLWLTCPCGCAERGACRQWRSHPWAECPHTKRRVTGEGQ